MPLYEYECSKCKKRFERIEKFSDPPLKTCPTCRGKVSRVISSPAFQFKGSGWYVTDYAKKGSSGDGDGAKPAAEKPSEKTEEKPKAQSKDVTPQKVEPPRRQDTKKN